MARKNAKTKPARLADAGDDSSSNGRAAGVPLAARASCIVRLRRAKGQIEGIERMITDGRPSTEIITQITAARASLQVVAKGLLEAHLRECHEAAATNGGVEVDQMYQQLMVLVTNMAK